ncbi:hypothetical protein CDG60_08630 [Acinetobacter chinensis]|uniref:Uncharacterized protein n=1 Tax=Acinetobacter chinensis TaxID=2004650 RepID=A0A3B7LYC0_9GAMM|nr:hypothetical protein [Acinetobacter chinensis]AXY56627.1 hypothetical protein CDG60_08630 [Acinetobacter chinensis]
MTSPVEKRSLAQIYYFVNEKPGFRELSNFDKAVIYFKCLHMGSDSSFFVEPRKHLLHGDFGGIRTIALNFIPNFSDNAAFLTWAYNELYIKKR